MDIAVFPIPDMVALPGQSHKVHVFEPRYRRMVQECIEKEMMIGLALPQKILSAPNHSCKARSDLLRQNHETYKAETIMGAGVPELVKTLDDGRLLVKIEVVCRVRIVAVKRYLPYCVVEAEDLPQGIGETECAGQLADDLLSLSGYVLGKRISLGGEFASDPIHRLKALVLWVFSWFELDAQTKQNVLELRTETARAELLISCLQDYIATSDVQEGDAQDSDAHTRREIKRDGNLIQVDFRQSEP